MAYIGDYRLGDTIYTKFTTVQSTGAPTTLAGTPVVSAYPNNSTTELTAGITLTVDFDTRTGLNHLTIVASGGNGYATATDYQLVITTGTVNSVSAVGYVVAEFSIENRSALRPATAARQLVVDASGLADANVVKLGPSGSGTAQTARDIGASVLLSAGTGTGQLDFTSGVVKSNGTQWNGAAVTTPLTAGTPVVEWVPSGWRQNTAQAGAAGSITLDASASATDNFYKYCKIVLLGGTGAGQARLCTGYTGSTKVATVVPNWTTNPDSTSKFATMPLALADLEAISAAAVSTSSAQLGVNAVNIGGAAAQLDANNLLKVDVEDYKGTSISAPATAGLPDVNVKNINAVSASAVTTVKPVIGLTTADTVATATSVTNPVALTSSERNSVADALLDRDMSTGTDSGSPTVRTVRQALRMNRNKINISAGTLTVYKEDDATSSWTAAVTTTAGNPITTIDPA